MNYFRYKLIKAPETVVTGVVRLPYEDEISAISHLERDQNTVMYAKKLGPALALLLRLRSLKPKGRITRSFLAEFFSNVSLMLRAGLSLTKALEEAADTADRPQFATKVEDMIFDIRAGKSFSEAAVRHRKIFPRTVIHLIRLGEETGQLAERLKDASQHLLRIQKIISDTKQALLYPSFVILSMSAGFLFWFYYVVPKIVGLFQEMDVALPALTVMILNISHFLQNHMIAILIATALSASLAVTAYRGNRNVRKAVSLILLQMPVARTLFSASQLAFISEHLSLLLNAGIDVIQSVTIIGDAMKDELYREKLDTVRQNLRKGEGISESFLRGEVFPRFVVRMIKVGEESGSLPEQLDHVAEDCRNRLSVIVATLGKFLEPAVLVVAGTMFAIIVGGLFLPIYDLVSRLSG